MIFLRSLQIYQKKIIPQEFWLSRSLGTSSGISSRLRPLLGQRIKAHSALLSSTPDQMGDSETSAILTQKLLTPVRESIINKPPFISGKLELPASCFSLLYRVTKDGHEARFEHHRRLGELLTFLS
jgi:hypothetical protein